MPRGQNGRRGQTSGRADSLCAVWRAELLREKVIAARRASRAHIRMAEALSRVPGYAALRREELRIDVQAEIDHIELKIMNAQRAEVGLEPLCSLPLN